MKRLTLCVFLGLTGMTFLFPDAGYAQVPAQQRGSDQVMNELLNEVRLLRQDLRKLSSTSYRAHTMIERLRLQQGQVNRLTLALSTVRGELATIKSSRGELKEKLAGLQKKYDVGMVNESELNAVKAILAEMDQREPDLTVRESQLAQELNLERVTLEELNKKLDAIEQELVVLSQDNEKRP